MTITTAGDLIRYAFRTSGINGVGQTPSDDDFNDAMTTLQTITAQWQRKRWLVWDLVETTVVATGAQTYTVGPGLQIPIARTDRVESAFARLLPSLASTPISGNLINNGGVVMITGGSLPISPVGLPAGAFWNNGGVLMITPGVGPSTGNYTIDFPLAIIESWEDYNSIAFKNFSSVPGAVFYDSGWPTGLLYVWPIPAGAAYELHIFTKRTLPGFAAQTDPLNVPPEYIEALKYALVVHLTMDWGLDPKPSHVAAMKASMNTIRVANTAIATLRMPPGVSGRSRVGTDRAGFQVGWRA